jgi:lipid-A-disaccharide synthase
VLKNYFKFRRLFSQLLALAIERKPDVVIGVDFGGFNLRFGHAVKEYVRHHPGGWNPKIVQFVSPQVWASRPGRAKLLEEDYDLLLSIFPFEKDWYAKRVPKLRVEFVGHPIVERLKVENRRQKGEMSAASPNILLLPGSRKSELQRHLLVIVSALKLIQEKFPNAKAKLVLSNENLARTVSMELDLLKKLESAFEPKEIFRNLEIQVGNLPDALAEADVAIASTGTVTMECAFFGVPTVTLYKTSALTYQIAKRIVTVKSLTMPNLLAGEEVYPEFVQNAATPESISRAALELLQNEPRRRKIKSLLERIVSSLGEPGATKRAADAIFSLFK